MSEQTPDASAPHRTSGHLRWESLDARLCALREVWVATADTAGRPDAVPVWFWWDGTALYFSTHPQSAKARNLTNHPEIVVHNGDGADPIIIRGTAELVRDSVELARVDAAYRAKYIDPHSGTEAPVLGLDETPAAVFRVRPPPRKRAAFCIGVPGFQPGLLYSRSLRVNSADRAKNSLSAAM